LEDAVAAYREALKERTRKKVSLWWATTQNNLGAALARLGERESGTERLQAAVAAFHEALKERTREKVPLQWAGTQNNLGDALESMGKLEEAAESFRLALQVFTPENHFPMYTGATNNLAHVLEKLRAGKENE
jgi:tetratricopeptide (TPR) repeat protein